MIFVTVGTQLPFDRLIRAMDEWTGCHGCPEVFAQIGPTEYRPRHLQWAPFIGADECARRVRTADAVVAHAGMGSILTALEYGKPLIIMPRRGDLLEHRNDHQLATVSHLGSHPGISVAFDEQTLQRQLEKLVGAGSKPGIPPDASPRLIQTLRGFVGAASAGTAPRRPEPRPSGFDNGFRPAGLCHAATSIPTGVTVFASGA